MTDGDKTKEQLIQELEMLRARVAELEATKVERARVEEALVQEQYLMRALMDNLPDHIYFKDTQSRFIRISKSQSDRFGLSDPAQAVRKTDFDFFTEEHARQAYEDEQSIIRTGQPMTREEVETWLDRPNTWVLTTKLPLRDETGNIVGTCGISREITERKRIEEALRESEARYRAVIESQVDLISRYLPDTTLTFVNDAYCQFYGKTREELIGHSYLFMIAPEFRDLVRKETENLAKDPRPIMGEYLNYRQDGRECWIQWAVQCISDENGQVVELQAVGHDITERKWAEEALKDSQERYRTLFEDSPVSLWEEDFSAAKTYIDCLRGAGVQDLRNYFENHPEAVMQCADMVRVVDVNKAALEWHHVANKEALQGNLSRLLSPEGCEDIKEELMGLVEGGTRYELASARQDRGGNPLHLIVTGTVAPGYEDSWGRVLVSILDITELKQAEEALRQYADENARLYREVQGYAAELEQRVEKRTAELSAANAELARASRAKDEFLSGMSHELRTPLTAILGLSEVLQEQVFGPLNEKQAKYVQTIGESGHHLLSLITDILDLSKIEAGKMELEIGLVAIDAVCQASLQFIKQTALKKQLKVCSTVDQQVTLIQADERRLKQILVNLLSNAVKFTPAGGQVGLEVMGNVERGRVDLSVWDTGIGIAPEDMGRLFRSFVQLDSSLSRQYTGTGLGLALVRQLTDMHGGSVSVESQVGQGSRFTVSLPWYEARGRARVDKGQVGQVAEKPGPPVSESSGQLVTILLAEDNETNLGVMSDYVSAMGYRVIVARDGHEAIRRAREEKPEVILMDIQMPGLDGLEAIRRIRTEAGLGKTPIIALTALTMPGDRERCLEAGANDYLSKPVGLRNLLSAIEAQLAHHEREE